MLPNIAQFITNVARHAVPLGGIFGRSWHPVTALGVYWLESVALALATACLCALMARRTDPIDVTSAGIQPSHILQFFLGSFVLFGVFLGVVVLVALGNGHITEPLRWNELREAAQAMLAVVAVGFLFDLWSFNQFSITDVQNRVHGCLARWGLFWIVGFFGVLLMMFTGRATLFFGLFAVLKVGVESWGQLARRFGWKPKPAVSPATPARDRSTPPAAQA